MPVRSCSPLTLTIAVGWITLTLGGAAAWAQEPVLEHELPDSIVVTANRYPEHVNVAGRRVSVWTAADIERLPVSSYDEMLRTVGGVEVLTRGGFGVQSDVTMRGSTFNGVLVLLDGVRLNDPMTGHFLTDIPIPVSEISRIEVVRGPAAAVYGPDAVGGVIQIFTHAAADRSQLRTQSSDSSKIGIDARAEGGDYGLYNFDLAVRPQLQSGPYLSLAASLEGAGGPPIRNQDGQPIIGSSGALTSDFKRQSQTVAVAGNLGEYRLAGRIGRDHREFSAFHFYAPFPSDTARESTTTLWGHARLEGRFGRDSWGIQGSLKQHDDRYVYNPITPANEHVSRMAQIHGHVIREISDALLMTGGASAAWRSIDSNNLGRHRDGAAGVFFSLRWHPHTSAVFTGSARADYDDAFGMAYTPQVTAVLDAGRIGLHAMAGRSVRAPNYIERFFNTTLTQLRGRSVGNPNLNPERARSYEAGASVYPLDGVALHVTGFLRITDDLIDYARVSPVDTVFLARNLHTIRTSGWELDASVNRRLGSSLLRADASLTLLEADLGDLDAGVEYQYVLTNARRLGQIAVGYSFANLHAGIQTLWRDPLVGDAYGVTNVRMAYGIHMQTGTLLLSAELRNAFNREYSEVFDAPMPPRWWLMGVRYRQ